MSVIEEDSVTSKSPAKTSVAVEQGVSATKLDNFVIYMSTMVSRVYFHKIKILLISIVTTEFKTIVNVCLNVFISCYLFWILICRQPFYTKAKLPVLNAG